MALIKCSECGKEISDKASSCLNCGCPASEFKQQPEDTRSEVERVADEIFGEKPDDSFRNARKLSKVTGIPYDVACGMINERKKQWKVGKKQGLYPDTQYCPACGSQNIEQFENPGITVTSKVNVFGGMYLSSSSPSKMWIRCNTCKNKWQPKRK